MSLYCDNCYITFEGKRCPVCGKKSDRGPLPDDPCFLTEKESLWAGMLEDVLGQNGVPFYAKKTLGAALALKVGPLSERSVFYVPFRFLEKAQSLVEELFAAQPVDDEPPEDQA